MEWCLEAGSALELKPKAEILLTLCWSFQQFEAPILLALLSSEIMPGEQGDISFY